MGDSLESSIASGSLLLRRPDQPINFAENMAQKTISTIGLTWDAGVESGGYPILDYRLTVTTTGDPYIFKSFLTSTSFTANSLTKGTLYKFKV
jgi:hypothetical protein